MKIVINTIPLLVPLTGVGHYIYNLLIEFQRLRPDFTYTFYYGYGYFSKKLKMYREGEVAGFYRLKEWVKKISVLSTQARKLEHRLPQINFRKYDIYFEPNFTPLDMRSKRIVTTVHDFSFHLHPEWHPRERVAYLSKNFFKRIEKADLIITGSRYIEREAHELLNGKGLRIVTIYYGYNHALFHAYKKAEEKKDLLGGVIVLTGNARAADPAAVLRAVEGLAADAAADDEEDAPPASMRRLAPGAPLRPRPLVLIPYYAWAHRGETEMSVWLFKK